MPHLLRDRRLLQDNQPLPILDGYLLNDTFATDRAAGAVNGTPAEPGPGRRTVVDTNSKLSLSGGEAVFATGGVTAGDPGLWYDPPPRAPGQVLLASASYSAGGVEVGWDLPGSGNVTDCVRMTGTTLAIRANLTALTVGTAAASTTYRVAVVQRAAGNLYFVKGGAFTNWTLIWIGTTGAGAQPNIVALTSATAAIASIPRVPAEKWLPSPLASDGFSVWGTTDGGGHAEGVAGGLGSGGSGLTWTTRVGTLTVVGGKAQATALSGSIAVATVPVATSDMIVASAVTRVGATVGSVVKWVDSNNYILIRHDGTFAQLFKVVSGSATPLISTTATHVAGAQIVLICRGTEYRLFYNNAAIGSTQTIADAVFTGVANAGVYTSGLTDTIDDFFVYASGSGGEYAALDAF